MSFSDDLHAVRAIRVLMARSRRECSARCGAVMRRFRERYAKGTLPAHIAAGLDAIPGWIWVGSVSRYAGILKASEEYARLHGLGSVDGTTTHRGYPIGRWLAEQRSRCRRGRISVWLRERLELLPGFSPREFRRASHQRRTAAVARRHLAALRAAGARSRPTRAVDQRASNRPWYLRRYFIELRKRGQLPPDIARELASLPGWSWRADTLHDRQQRLLNAARRAARKGSLRRVPTEARIGGCRLGAWLATCRRKLRLGLLSKSVGRSLAAIDPGWYLAGRDARDHEKLSLLRRFLRHHSMAELASHRTHGGHDLRSWVRSLVARRRKGVRRPIDRELEALPGWTWEPRAARIARLARAARLGTGSGLYRHQGARQGEAQSRVNPELDLAYVRMITAYLKGRTRVGFGVDPRYKGVQLRHAVTMFRRRHAHGILPGDTVAALERIPGWSWAPVKERFERNLALARQFIEKCGYDALTAGVVFEGVAIGEWMASQRGQYREGQLTPEFRKRLETLPGFRPFKDRRAVGLLARLELLERHTRAVRDHYSGRKRVPQEPVPGGRGTNLAQLRQFFGNLRRKRQLPPGLKEELERIPGFFGRSARHDSQARKIQLIRKLAGTSGLPDIDSSVIVEGVRLGAWVRFCCQRHREGRLDPRLERDLERIPGWTWRPSRAERMQRKLGLLRQFLQDRDYEDLPRHPTYHGVNLHNLVLGLRKSYHKGRLRDELIRECERLRGWSWHPLEDARPVRWGGGRRASRRQDEEPG